MPGGAAVIPPSEWPAELPPSPMEPIALWDGRVMMVHAAHVCSGPPCSIHAPSDHPLRLAPLFWDAVHKIMWRRCVHEIRHPDPDDLDVQDLPWLAVHKCDGCCGHALWTKRRQT